MTQYNQTATINIIDYTWTYENIDKYIAVIVISIKLANKKQSDTHWTLQTMEYSNDT